MKKFTTFLCALLFAMSASAEVVNLTISQKPRVQGNSSGTYKEVYILMDSEENYSIALYIPGTLEMENGKTYTFADMFTEDCNITDYNTYNSYNLTDAAITWTKDAKNLERFEGYVIDINGTTYNFLYQEKELVPTGDTIKVRVSKAGQFEYNAWNKYWYIFGVDYHDVENMYNVYFTLNSGIPESPAGHYTEVDFVDPKYNHIYVTSQGQPSKDYRFHSGEIDIIERNDSILLYANMLAEDGNVYNIFIYYADPKPIYHKIIRTTMTVDKSRLEESGVIYCNGINADYQITVSLWPRSSEAYHGIYTYGEDCDLRIYDRANNIDLSIFSATLTITAGENGDVLTGKVLCLDNTEYEIYMAEGDHSHLDYDRQDADFEAVYDDYELYEVYDDGYVIVQAANEDSQAMLGFYVAEGATSFTAGTYTCTTNGAPMTVYTGSSDGFNTYVSFFMDKYFSFWFPYAGTATVGEDGVIVFDAWNSYDRLIKVTLNPKKVQGIQNIEKCAPSTNKRLENGMLIIEKNGVKYNVIGNVIE